ncbi:MAG: RDD family protein [Bdellovibrio sp.]|nr:RDD family protein [Bdellovibrio sp.]
MATTSNDDKKTEDWDFKINDVEKEDRLEKGSKRAVSDTGVRKLIKRNKSDDLKLAYDKVPKRASRSDAEAYINKSQHTHGTKDTSTPMLAVRAQAFAIDAVIIGVFYLLARNAQLLDVVFNWVDQAMLKSGMGQLPDNPNVDYILSGGIFAVCYFCIFVVLTTFTAKSPGKFVAKILVDDIDGGDIGFVRTFLREMIFKPISAVSIIGILIAFMNPHRRALHDFLAKSVVRKDYNH